VKSFTVRNVGRLARVSKETDAVFLLAVRATESTCCAYLTRFQQKLEIRKAFEFGRVRRRCLHPIESRGAIFRFATQVDSVQTETRLRIALKVFLWSRLKHHRRKVTDPLEMWLHWVFQNKRSWLNGHIFLPNHLLVVFNLRCTVN